MRLLVSAVDGRRHSDGFTRDRPSTFTDEFTHDGATRVYRGGSGPGVVVVHEVPGITPLVADFGRRVVDAGFTVAMPSLFGEPGRAMSGRYILSVDRPARASRASSARGRSTARRR